jgi:hypothetical protein
MKARNAAVRAAALGSKGQYRAAFRVLLAAARRGDASVFLNLGYAYDVGQGVRRSKRQALRWYRASLATSGGSAAHNIGTIYRDQGDAVVAARWFQRAIAAGSPGSRLEYGQLLLAGLGQPREALEQFRQVSGNVAESEAEAAARWAAEAEDMLARADGDES